MTKEEASKKVSISRGQENDMVYRQDVIDDLDEWIEIYGADKCVDAQAILKQVKRSIKKLPSVQPESKWIPCSERLPEPYEYCLWTTIDGRVVCHHCDGLFSKYIAWMPLPEPWKGEQP